ncbi:hypothetical protein [Yimella sp. cx-51]|uniref:hypothetical protein n=1 Tax=Yimella sp. cx-51 TaxID=2770551 RepID=UPI00165E771B|nr:hypothetical protein [Yimella sp. cx-51]MBC9955515.1 hypothetical protein [Yimella sp. cx-51]QTH37900.1 hypothetical protein J5M86_13825 [Yimella sp. cx-51]
MIELRVTGVLDGDLIRASPRSGPVHTDSDLSFRVAGAGLDAPRVDHHDFVDQLCVLEGAWDGRVLQVHASNPSIPPDLSGGSMEDCQAAISSAPSRASEQFPGRPCLVTLGMGWIAEDRHRVVAMSLDYADEIEQWRREHADLIDLVYFAVDQSAVERLSADRGVVEF